MQYFFLCRDKPDAGALRRALLKDHWAFMHPYIERMSARGPTMSADGSAVTGSMHIVDLPDAAAAQVFAHDDPLARGGVFDRIAVRRFENSSGRSMWQFKSAAGTAQQRYLFVAEAAADAVADGRRLCDAQRAYLCAAERAAQVILFGSLLDDDGRNWSGSVILLEAADRAAAEALVQGDPASRAGACSHSELLPWRFGGAENLQDLLNAK